MEQLYSSWLFLKSRFVLLTSSPFRSTNVVLWSRYCQCMSYVLLQIKPCEGWLTSKLTLLKFNRRHVIRSSQYVIFLTRIKSFFLSLNKTTAPKSIRNSVLQWAWSCASIQIRFSSHVSLFLLLVGTFRACTWRIYWWSFDVIAWTIKDIVNANCESKVLDFAHNNRFA